VLNVFCLNLSADASPHDGYLVMLRVAVHSCVSNTSLKPVLLHSCRLPPDMHAWLRDAGVMLVDREVSFADTIRRHLSGWQVNWALGAFLRCDIPTLFPDEDRVLYTDLDVVFRQDPTPHVDFDMDGLPIGMCWEVAPTPEGCYMSDSMRNSGVILFNNRWFRDNPVDFGAFGESRDWKFDCFDQGMLNELFATRTYPLPPEFNWRPYQGDNDRQIITHHHMFKPLRWNEPVTDYPTRDAYITDEVIQSVLANTGHSIRQSVGDFRRLKADCDAGMQAIQQRLASPEKRPDGLAAG